MKKVIKELLNLSLRELDVVKVVNFPVNFPQYWNQEGTVVYVHCGDPGYYMVEFSDGELVTLHEKYLELWTSSVY